jgi:hypothetical protein
MSERDDSLVSELRTFFGTYAEHDPDCPAFDAIGPAVTDPRSCLGGLTLREHELITQLKQRLGLVGGAS